MKILTIAALSAILLAGCATKPTIVDNTRFIPVVPPKTLLVCDKFKNFPDGNKLTNRQVADTIKKLMLTNNICYTNMMEIRNFIEESEKKILEQNKK